MPFHLQECFAAPGLRARGISARRGGGRRHAGAADLRRAHRGAAGGRRDRDARRNRGVMRVLVAGAAGQLGRAVVESFFTVADVTAITRRRPRHQQRAGRLPSSGWCGAGRAIVNNTHAESVQFEMDTAVALAGSMGVVDEGSGLLRHSRRYISRQQASLGGGTTEIGRNIIGERILGFPREPAADRGVPFNQVKRNKS